MTECGRGPQYLEWREKQYDVRLRVDVYGRDPGPAVVKDALVYVATPNQAVNRNWLGPAPLELIAAQIATARGPSGPNWEYLFQLADAMLQVCCGKGSHLQ